MDKQRKDKLKEIIYHIIWFLIFGILCLLLFMGMHELYEYLWG